MTIASDASARRMSDSEISPTPARITRMATSEVRISVSSDLSTSRVPFTSDLSTTLISRVFASSILSNRPSRVTFWRSARSALAFASCRSPAIFLAFAASSRAYNRSPASGRSLRPVSSTGVAGGAASRFSPDVDLSVLILPWAGPQTTVSPRRRVPSWIRAVTTLPWPVEARESRTVPMAFLLGFAFNSRISDSRESCSSN